MIITIIKGILCGLGGLWGLIYICISIPKDIKKKPLYLNLFKYQGIAMPLTFSFIIIALYLLGYNVPDYIFIVCIISFFIGGVCNMFYDRLKLYAVLQNKISKSENKVLLNVRIQASSTYKTILMILLSLVMDIFYESAIMKIIELN